MLIKLLLINMIAATKIEDSNFQSNSELTYMSSPVMEFPPKFSNKPFIFDNKLYLPPDTQTQSQLPFFKNGEPTLQFLPFKDQTMQNIADRTSDWPHQLNGMFVQTPEPFHTHAQTNMTLKTKDDGKNELNFKSKFNLNNRDPHKPLTELITENPYLTSTRPIPKPVIADRIDYLPDLTTTRPIFPSEPVGNIRRTLIQQSGVEFRPQAKTEEQIPDQYHTDSSQHSNYEIPLPVVPILRQISEMDLEGSFSYESLTGDQTHVVQHGYVENLGTENEEQVVQGSYSFVSDDGQTYTVHYIADGNGFRASGDHLPVAPPIPEIIQKSVEYNMAKEAKDTHATKDYHNFANSEDTNSKSVPVPSQHTFIETKPPAAFSVNKVDTTTSQNNALQTSSSNQYIKYQQAPASFAPHISQTQTSSRLYSISPQLTFPASQGAYVPSRPIEAITRTYTPSSIESPNKSGIVQSSTSRNYIAPHTETEHSSNFWQYQRTYVPTERNILNKSSISRSEDYVEDDEILINFEDMSPEDYAKAYFNNYATQDSEFINNDIIHDYKRNVFLLPTNGVKDNNVRSSIITAKTFLPEPQIVNTSYNFQQNQQQDKTFEPSRSNEININSIVVQDKIPQNYRQNTPENMLNTLKSNQIKNSESAVFKPRESEINNYLNYNSKINYNNKIQTQNKNDGSYETVEEINKLSLPKIKYIDTYANDYRVLKHKENLGPSLFKQESKLENIAEPELNMMEAIKQNLFLKPIFEKKEEKLPSKNDITSKQFDKPKEQIISKQKQLDNKENHKHMKLADEINSNKNNLAQIIALLNVKSNFESSKLEHKPDVEYGKLQYDPNLNNNRTQNSMNEGLHKNANWKKTKDNQLENNTHEKNVNEARKKVYTLLQRNRPTSNKAYAQKIDDFSTTVNTNRYKDLNNRFEKSLPHLGRAGPSQKIYTPPQIPIYR